MQPTVADRQLASAFAGPAFQLRDTHARAPEFQTLTDTAEQIGEEQVCRDMGLLSAWIDQQTGGTRAPSSLGLISTTDLVGLVLLNPSATDDQLARAARELRARYLAENRPEVVRHATEAMQA